MYLTILNVYNKQILCPLDRLVDPTGRTTCGYENFDELCVSVNSWWAGRFTLITKLDLCIKEYI